MRIQFYTNFLSFSTGSDSVSGNFTFISDPCNLCSLFSSKSLYLNLGLSYMFFTEKQVMSYKFNTIKQEPPYNTYGVDNQMSSVIIVTSSPFSYSDYDTIK